MAAQQSGAGAKARPLPTLREMRNEALSPRSYPKVLSAWLGLLLAGLLALVSLRPAAALAAPGGGLLVSPARIELDLPAGGELPPVTVTNRGDEPLRLRLEVGTGGHDRSGAPRFDVAAPWGPPGARLVVEPAHFTLAPGESRAVRPRLVVPRGWRGGLYPVLFVGAEPARPVPGVVTVHRVAVLFLLRVGGGQLPAQDPGELFRLSELRVEQPAPGRPLTVVAALQNRGPVHQRVGVEAEIRSSEGATLARVPLGPATVLPGLERELKSTWRPPELPPGQYRLVASLVALAGGPASVTPPALRQGPGGSGQPVEVAFTVVAPYELARADAAVQQAWVPLPDQSEWALEVALQNRGNVPLAPVVSLRQNGVELVQASFPPIPPQQGGLVQLRPWPLGGGLVQPWHGELVLEDASGWRAQERVTWDGSVVARRGE